MSTEDEKIAVGITCLCTMKLVSRDADKSIGMFFSSHCQMGIRQVYVKIHALLVRNQWLIFRNKFSYEEIQLFFPQIK